MTLFLRIILILALVTLHSISRSEKSCEAPNRKCFRVTALVPARAGSKGIKDKNLSRIGNETLIERTVRIVNECGDFHSVWVSTDGQSIADAASRQGANIHWRDPKTATDKATTVSAVKDFVLNHSDVDAVAVVQCTSPFLQKEYLCKALDEMIKYDLDCIFTVTKSHQLRWTFNTDGFVSALNFDPKKRPRRQDWEGEFVENGMFYFAKKDLIVKNEILQNERCRVIEIPKQFSIEIDTEFDLKLAREMMKLFKGNTKEMSQYV